ncbi:MAG: ABC transporter permease [Candidatus Doudnabacteria bacterium]|nr:ABC transporter permease [Candidatus Doudnabacteria bacterium]
MFTAFKQSIKALSANPARTVLTTLGIMIGISTVILVLSAGAGFRSLINDQVNALGSNTLFIQTRVPPTTKNRAASSAGGGPSEAAFSGVVITSFKQRDLDDIAKLNNVVGDYGEVIGQAVVSYGNTDKSAMYYGASASKFQIDQHTLKEGRFYTQAEDNSAAQVAILGDTLAQNLFNQTDPIGQLIHVGNLNFQVIGVYNPLGLAGGGTADDSLYLPLGTAQKKLLGIDYLAIGVVQLKDINLSDVTTAQINNIMAYNHSITDPVKYDFTVESQAQALATFNVIFNGITILLIAIAAISLIVGGVGIMNIMYVVVTERTAEIGLKKALGAKNSDILSEFLMESILVTIIGGVIGILFGGFLGWIISLIATSSGLTWTFSVPVYAILLAVGVSAAIGISFGVLPARQASKMDPITALQYE